MSIVCKVSDNLLYFNCPLFVLGLNMKVNAKETIRCKMRECIQQIPGPIILRSDLKNLASDRQLSRGLKSLVQEGALTKIGYGTYAKLSRSPITPEPFLKEGFNIIAKEALKKLQVEWEASSAERAYNICNSTQIPFKAKVKLKSRFNRKLSYKGNFLEFE